MSIKNLKGRKLYLLCGVSGSGKTWVCKQLANEFNYVPHDEHYSNIYAVCAHAAFGSSKPIITECPFGERIQRENFRDMGFDVEAVFVIEHPDLIARRYAQREGRPIRKEAYTRASSIVNRAREWGGFYGTSQQVLDYLKGL